MRKLDPKLINAPIVVVDDDPDDLYLFEKMVQRLGIFSPLRFFENGKDALDYLNTTEEQTFLIMSDINMPVMNGLELRNQINRNERLRRKSIPFIFFSTAARAADVIEAYDMTVQGFFVKDAELESIEDTLEVIFHYWTRCKHPNSARNAHGLI
jgi:CheY-like chemotaxis protein